nr:hypothetical protein [Tanacetum cinerariifolium]
MVPQVPLLISFNVEEVGKQVAVSTQTFKIGKKMLDFTMLNNLILIPYISCSIPIKSVVDKDYGISLDQRTHLRAELNVRLEVLRHYGCLDSYAYAFTCVLIADMCSAGSSSNGYQGIGDEVGCQRNACIARASRVEIHNAIDAWIAGMLLISDGVCEYQFVRTESRNVASLLIALVIEKPQLVAINNRTLSLQNAAGQLGMSDDQLRSQLNANGISLTLSLQNAAGQLGMSADQLRSRLNANSISLYYEPTSVIRSAGIPIE